MQRKLSEDEKSQIRAERLDYERKWFPEFDIDVIVEDVGWGSGRAHCQPGPNAQ